MFINRNPHDTPTLPRNTDTNTLPSDLRKKIQNYSFLLTDRIGKGYSSTVYRGTDDLTQEQVAIKVIELRSLRDNTSRLMLQTEIDCFREVRHPNVLRYINSFFTANNCYIVTEYCAGSDLAKLLRHKGRLTEAEAKKYFAQIFEGYCAFHQAGYVHRDLKPANIFVTREGTLKLADFGFSKRRTLIDKENYNVGTPIYMPKESLNDNIYNEKTDIWALGVTLYEMLYGEVPFRGRTEQELKLAVERGMVYFPPQVVVSSKVKDFIRQTLSSDPNLRMGIRQIRSHPWFSQLDCSLTVEKKEVAQVHAPEVQNRISLPQEGMVANKSREYFEAKQNRRSASSTQKLKLSIPNKGSLMRANREPLKELNQNTTPVDSGENKENKLQNESKNVSGLQVIKTLRKRKDSEASCTANGIQKMICLINYFRFLYKIYEKVNNNTELSGIQSIRRAHNLLMSRIAQIFRKHLSSIKDRSNQFELQSLQWINFAMSDRWPMYEFVIGKYSSKYRNIIESCEFNQMQWVGANSLFCELWENYQEYKLKSVMTETQKKCFLEVATLMSHLGELDSLIGLQGWAAFANKYQHKSQELLMQNLALNEQNVGQMEVQLGECYGKIGK